MTYKNPESEKIIYSNLNRPYEEPGCVLNGTQFIMNRIGEGMDVKYFSYFY